MVIPCFRVGAQIVSLLNRIGSEVDRVYVVDDACPEQSGDLVRVALLNGQVRDGDRVCVLTHEVNKGVGGAVITGFRRAIADGFSILVKVDGDGQMDPCLIPEIIRPLRLSIADYVKGNRFFHLESLASMPKVRLFGNSVLSFLTKIASGYWNVMDPNNGFIATNAELIKMIPLHQIDEGYFFESDMLCSLGLIRGVVYEVPMDAFYGKENSSLPLLKVSWQFPLKLFVRAVRRIFYTHFLRDFNACSLALVVGGLLTSVGVTLSVFLGDMAYHGVATSTTLVCLAAAGVILGVQFLLAAIQFDIVNVPVRTLTRVNGCSIFSSK